MNNILEIKNLSYAYEQNKEVLHNININIEEGKSYSIVGKSGSGKSTLISLLAGLENIKKGDIIYNQKNLKTYNLNSYRAKDIGIIFQQYNLLNNYTIADNILLAMNIAKIKPDINIVYSLLEKVGLNKNIIKKKPLQLSGGQQQRIAIARALASNPKIIIADEPTGNLDENTEKEIINLLKDLVTKEKKTLIIVTHSNYVSTNTEHVFGLTNGHINIIK